MKASATLEKTIQEVIPKLYQNQILCAGVSVGNQGSCKGDSGGPLMFKDDESGKFFQIATVRGAVGQCGERDYPGIFVRVDNPSIWKFISSIIQPNKDLNKGKI
jgi:secreted trypsin-like serine protease